MVLKCRFLSYRLHAHPRVSLKFIEAIFYSAESRKYAAHSPCESSGINSLFAETDLIDRRCLSAFIDASIPSDHHDVIQTKKVVDRASTSL